MAKGLPRVATYSIIPDSVRNVLQLRLADLLRVITWLLNTISPYHLCFTMIVFIFIRDEVDLFEQLLLMVLEFSNPLLISLDFLYVHRHRCYIFNNFKSS